MLVAVEEREGEENTRQDERMGQGEQVLAERNEDVIFPLFEFEKTMLKNAVDYEMFDDGRAKT